MSIRNSDHADIEALLVRYCTGIDSRDWELFSGVFTPDCRLDYGDIGSWHGPAEVTRYMREVHAPMGHTLHRVSNVTVTFQPEMPDLPRRARVHAYVDALLLDAENKRGINAVGSYTDLVVRTHAGWQIAERDFTMMHTSSLG